MSKKRIVIIIVGIGVSLALGIHFRNGVNTGQWIEVNRTDGFFENPITDFEDRKEFGSSYLKSPVSVKYNPIFHYVELKDGSGQTVKSKYKSDYLGTGLPRRKNLRAVGSAWRARINGHTLSIETWNTGAGDAGHIEAETQLWIKEVDRRKVASPDYIVLKRK